MNILGINCGYFWGHFKTGLFFIFFFFFFFFFWWGGGVISMHFRVFFLSVKVHNWGLLKLKKIGMSDIPDYLGG